MRSIVIVSLAALVVGIIAGLGAWLFRSLIAFFQNLLFLGDFSFAFDPTAFIAESPWGPGIILVPAVVAGFVAWLVKTFAPEAKGHGVPEVMDAIHYNEGRIRPQVVVVKALASALSIGSGGSAGREGPIIQIGAAMGSNLAQIIRLPVGQRLTLVAAGAGAGIAAAFNAPLGGLVFAIELMLLATNATTLLPVAIACVAGAYITRVTAGMTPAFNIPTLQVFDLHAAAPWGLVLMVPLGIVMGLASSLFIKALDKTEDAFEAIPGGYIVQHMIGMLLLGVLIYAVQQLAGHYYVAGVGYATIEQVLEGVLANPWFLLILFALKLLATCLTLGSGASGGVFSPSLFMGAALGAMFGHVSMALFGDIGVPITAFALAGMAAAISGTTGALLTAIAMTYEMTRDYNAILLVLIAATTSWTTRKMVVGESIYTIKLLRRGHVVPEGLQIAMDHARRAGDVMREGVPDTRTYQVVNDAGTVKVVNPTDQTTIAHIVVERRAGLVDVLKAMEHVDAAIALVTDHPARQDINDIIGWISAEEIARASRRTARLMDSELNHKGK
ncbi:MAG: chloride channel protein [Rhodospirillaceae bacterium]|nr:chloride channel protein [Rhodospirillaceae bacterium]MBT6206335.1 chloride channel protein [Rhodospirillaceae bacterium]MBT7615296.1 chloride channel protein [Rhodospirillaceae bacterium]MBT7649024.1 chloride channel protein [Rhodospirillaceae bacterium]